MAGIILHNPNIETGISIPLERNRKPNISISLSNYSSINDFKNGYLGTYGGNIGGNYNFDDSTFSITGGAYVSNPLINLKLNTNYVSPLFFIFSNPLLSAKNLTIKSETNSRYPNALAFLRSTGRIAAISRKHAQKLDDLFHYESGDDVIKYYDKIMSGPYIRLYGGKLNYLNYFK